MSDNALLALATYISHMATVAQVDCHIFDIAAKAFVDDDGLFCHRERNCAGCAGCAGCVPENTHLYGSYESGRWHNGYIYYCPAGLIFVAVAMRDARSDTQVSVIAGPVIMGEPGDFLNQCATPEAFAALPAMSTKQVNALAEVLYLVCCGLSDNPYQKAYHHIESKSVEQIVYSLYDRGDRNLYPIEYEKQLQQHIASGRKELAQETLNLILGHIYFADGSDFRAVRTRLFELITILSRASIEGGANVNEVFGVSDEFIEQARHINSFYELNCWANSAMHRFVDYVFDLQQVKHKDIIYKAVHFIRDNCDRKLTLEEVAGHVYLSKPYFSKLFKAEMGCNLMTYINKAKIEKSKALLLDSSLSIINVALAVGFEDQAYFSNVFKKFTGLSPGEYRSSRGAL